MNEKISKLTNKEEESESVESLEEENVIEGQDKKMELNENVTETVVDNEIV